MEEKSDGDMISTQKCLLSSHDPGWNDPPKWAYFPSPNACNTPVKRVLNKRVAFPLNVQPNDLNCDPNRSLTSQLASMPPSSLSVTSLPSTFCAPELAPLNAMAQINKEQTLNDTLINFESVISEHEELKDKAEEVKKKLETMKTLWMEDKLSDCICLKVFDISEALKNKDVATADKIHISLMMDRIALCNSWIPGIRHLILELKKKSAQTNVEEKRELSTYLLPTSTAN